MEVDAQEISHLVVHAVEQTRHHWEDSWLQNLHVLRQETNVTLEKPDPSSMTEHYGLEVGKERSRV